MERHGKCHGCAEGLDPVLTLCPPPTTKMTTSCVDNASPVFPRPQSEEWPVIQGNLWRPGKKSKTLASQLWQALTISLALSA